MPDTAREPPATDAVALVSDIHANARALDAVKITDPMRET